MLTTTTIDTTSRTGRSADPLTSSIGRASSVSRTADAARTAGSERAGNGFRQLLGEESSRPATGRDGAGGTGERAGAATRSQGQALHNSNIALIIPYRRGESAIPISQRSDETKSPAEANRAPHSLDKNEPGPKGPTPMMSASQVEWGARMLPGLRTGPYVVPNEIIGSIAPRIAGSGPGNTAFASNLYRVPDWGLQEFVTSDGARHRFDVEVVFPEAKASSWLGGPVKQIHPEVADFVVGQLRETLVKAGVPESAIAGIHVFRSFGGPGDRQFYMDNVQFVRADGEKFSGSMNVYMRDPKYTLPILQEFFLGEIPS